MIAFAGSPLDAGSPATGYRNGVQVLLRVRYGAATSLHPWGISENYWPSLEV